MLTINEKRISIIFTFIIYASYFLGFILNENSIGSGGYEGDLSWMWRNIELFKNNNLIEAIDHQDFYGNRTPLLYVINFLLSNSQPKQSSFLMYQLENMNNFFRLLQGRIFWSQFTYSVVPNSNVLPLGTKLGLN